MNVTKLDTEGCNTKKLHFFLALKGRNIPAQGNALGKDKKDF